MSYVALYRKFRPVSFDEVSGQEQAVTTLRNQVRTGRLQHAYLFCGTRGTGKTSVAKIFARAVNCEHPEDGNPCGVCETCKSIADGTSMNVIEIDAASNNGVDNIRDIIEEVQYRPTRGKYKIYIIDEVHMLSTGAFNALLKTLEEPPEYVIFILATTEVGKIPVTILSRCQRYDFRRIDVDTIAARMRELLEKEGVGAEEKALRFIARAADGSMRDGLSLLDRCIAFYMGEELTYDKALKALGEADNTVFSSLTRDVVSGNASGALRIFGRQVAKGVEIGQFISDYIWYLRNLLIVGSAGRDEAAEIVDLSGEQLTELAEMASEVDASSAMRYIRILSELQNRMRYATNRRVLTEIALLQLAKPQGDLSDDALTGRLHQLEERLDELAAGGYAVPVVSRREETPPDAEEEELELLPEAAPEDLRRVCTEWRQIISSMPDGFLKNRLKADARPQFNEETLENKLFVELHGTGESETADRLIVDHDENREELEQFLERRYGKRIEVELHLRKHRAPGLRSVDVDRMFDGIRANIEVTDEFEDDEF